MAYERLSYDPVRGVLLEFDYDEDNDLVYIRTTQDVAPHLEHAHFLRSLGRAHYARDPDRWHTSLLPDVIQYRIAQEYGVDVTDPEQEKATAKLLNGEFKAFKTGDIEL